MISQAPSNVSASSPSPGDVAPSVVLDQLSQFHEAQLALCSQLETIADSLPENFDAHQALMTARQIAPLVKRAHRFEEHEVFEIVQKESQINPMIDDSLSRLQFEHWEDEAYAEELCEALVAYASSSDHGQTDKLSYMLRGFFDNLRRHIAFEKEYIEPILRKFTT